MSSGAPDAELLCAVAPMAEALNFGEALRGLGADIARGRFRPFNVHKM